LQELAIVLGLLPGFPVRVPSTQSSKASIVVRNSKSKQPAIATLQWLVMVLPTRHAVFDAQEPVLGTGTTAAAAQRL
jgi:hypothetical protein